MVIGTKRQYQLRTGDFDSRADVMPASLLDIFQDIAGCSADEMGIGFDDMYAQNLIWAITRLKYEIVSMPSLHEQVEVETWPLAPTRAGFQREYRISGLSGQTQVKATSNWVVMNFAERSLVSVRDIYHGPDDFSLETSFETRAKKIPDFQSDEPPFSLTTRFCDIDVNGHVNNTKYATYVLDALDLQPHEHIHTFQIDFRHELKAGEPLDIYTLREQGGAHAKGLGPDGEHKFSCCIEFA